MKTGHPLGFHDIGVKKKLKLRSGVEDFFHLGNQCTLFADGNGGGRGEAVAGIGESAEPAGGFVVNLLDGTSDLNSFRKTGSALGLDLLPKQRGPQGPWKKTGDQ